ncbi:hypothetical protein GA830_12065 [Mesorhizobium sp. NBSH29]|uniref:phage regulatory CII family protein n=1 Tax=Mesorhizobium sp. NBSH29 TaxID=2654249 RepID=UPI001896728A|nr:phage regulatory CII family protein [Mesorhizobium sp. NBSH29]QPC87393.1 hypothetical protein GA830_12065 [Mesorhizobium sp. NBSH29]
MVPNANSRHFRLKAAQRDLIAACGGVERAAEIASYSKSAVGRWYNGDSPELMPLDALDRLETECGRDFVTEALAHNRGRRLTDRDGETGDAASILSHHAEVTRSFAELVQASALAFADGRVTPVEAVAIDRHCAALIETASGLRKAAASARGAGGLSVVGQVG